MILVGQYDSPFVRRVAISLKTLGFPYEHDTRSVFGDFDAMRMINPLGRIPSLVLESGEVLIDSAAILDWLDETVGPARALIPREGEARRRALQVIALATGAVDKIGWANYERLIRPPAFRWQEWVDRSLTQFAGALAALNDVPWPQDDTLDQAQITTGVMLFYVKITDPVHIAPGRYAALERLLERLERRPEFQSTAFSEYAVPRSQ